MRTGKLQPLGPYDLVASGLTKQTVPALLDRLRDIRGSLFVDAYLPTGLRFVAPSPR